MGFYEVEYYIVGIFLISTYFIYVFVVWLEERSKETTIGKGDQIQEVIHDVAHGKVGRMTEHMLNYEHDKKLMSVQVSHTDAPLLKSDLQQDGVDGTTGSVTEFDDEEEEKFDKSHLMPPTHAANLDSIPRKISSIIQPFPVCKRNNFFRCMILIKEKPILN